MKPGHRPHRIIRAAAGALLSAALLVGTAAAQGRSQPSGNWAAVDQALGRKGAMQPGGVMKYGFPRSDLQVSLADVRLRPAFALGSWVAFRNVGGGHAMAMGDLVLTEDEVGPVMRALQAGGVEQTAVHNHLQHESPRVMYVHIAADGDPVKLAEAIRTALGESHTPLGAPAAPSPAAAPLDLDTAGIARALGAHGSVNGGVYQVSVPRRETIREHGHEVPPAMGVATGMNFQPTGGGKAAITGDFVLLASEVNPVIRALQESGITVTALHSHMLDESPKLYFMHFWANDDAVKLARGLRGALDRMNVKRR
ncbi:MAG TPA: DUF1259 domain-containing protein [Gemmatimonadaceae bacterium]|nr:DUF1259 domain-containing protein [Gemmatimonadaceae bacterium]